MTFSAFYCKAVKFTQLSRHTESNKQTLSAAVPLTQPYVADAPSYFSICFVYKLKQLVLTCQKTPITHYLNNINNNNNNNNSYENDWRIRPGKYLNVSGIFIG